MNDPYRCFYLGEIAQSGIATLSMISDRENKAPLPPSYMIHALPESTAYTQ